MKEGAYEKDQAEQFGGQPNPRTLSGKELHQLAAEQARRGTELTQQAKQHLRAMQEPFTEEGGLSKQSMSSNRGPMEHFDGPQDPHTPSVKELRQLAAEQARRGTELMQQAKQHLRAMQEPFTEEREHSAQSMHRKRDLTDDSTSSPQNPKRRKDDISRYHGDYIPPAGQPMYPPYGEPESSIPLMTDPQMMSSGPGEAELLMTGPTQEHHEYPVNQSSPGDRGYQTPPEQEEPRRYPLVLQSPGGDRYTKPVDYSYDRTQWGKETEAMRQKLGKQMTTEIVSKKGKKKTVDLKLTTTNLFDAETRGANPGGFKNVSENAQALRDAYAYNKQNKDQRGQERKRYEDTNKFRTFLEEYGIKVPPSRWKEGKRIADFTTTPAVLAEAQRTNPHDQELQKLTLDSLYDAKDVYTFLEGCGIKVPLTRWETGMLHTHADILAEAQRINPHNKALRDSTADDFHDAENVRNFLEAQEVEVPTERKVPTERLWTASAILTAAKSMKPNDQALQQLTLEQVIPHAAERDAKKVRKYLDKMHQVKVPPSRKVKLDTVSDILAEAQRMKPRDQALQQLTPEQVIPLAQGQRASITAEQGKAGPATMHEETGIPAGTSAPSEFMDDAEIDDDAYRENQFQALGGFKGAFGPFDPRGFAE